MIIIYLCMYIYIYMCRSEFVCICLHMHVLKRPLKKCHENNKPKFPIQCIFGYNEHYGERITPSCNVDLSD